MNNINIASKKTKTLNIQRYVEIKSKYDSYYAQVYSLLASKMMKNKNKNELKLELANLYDTRFKVSSNCIGNIIVIRYTLTAIQDQYLPIEISSQTTQLFEEGTQIFKFSESDIIAAYRELSLYIKNYFDNKQNVSSAQLNDIISDRAFHLSSEEVIEFYNNPQPQAFEAWVSSLKGSEQTSLNFNMHDEHLKQTVTKHNFQENDYYFGEDVVTLNNLDQAYVTIGYKLHTRNTTINNLANMIFGAGVYSKLFKIIREQHSLSYNVRSTLLDDNLIRVSGGLNNDKYEFGLTQIDMIINELQAGNFDQELKLAKTNYLESLKRAKCNEMAYISMYNENHLKNTEKSFETIKSEIENATKQDIQNVFIEMKKLATVVVK